MYFLVTKSNNPVCWYIFAAISLVLGLVLIFNKKQSYGYELSKREIIIRKIEGVILAVFVVFVIFALQFKTADCPQGFVQSISDLNHISVCYPDGWKAEEASLWEPAFPGVTGYSISTTTNSVHKEILVTYNNSLGETSLGTPVEQRTNLEAVLKLEPILQGSAKITKIKLLGLTAYNILGIHDPEIWFMHNGHFYQISYTKNIPYEEVERIIDTIHFLN